MPKPEARIAGTHAPPPAGGGRYAQVMGKVAYTVSALAPDESTALRYRRWLVEEHCGQVIQAGALTAVVIEHDSPDSEAGRTVEARYVFESRAALATYLDQHAPALRAEGLKHFGPGTGVVFRRTVGVVHEVEQPR